MLDGIEIAEHTVVVALGITTDRQKQVLGLWEGATENAAVCRALLTHLIERGLRVDDGILVVMDGSKALRAAVRTVLGPLAQVQRCQVHKKRNVLEHLPEEARTWVNRKLDQAWKEIDYAQARAALNSLARTLEAKHPGAAVNLREGLQETLTVLRLGLPEQLRKTLRSTNPIESAFDKVRMHSRMVKRWRNGQQVLRWSAAGLLEAEKRFRRIKGHRPLPMLAQALSKQVAPESSSDVKTAENTRKRPPQNPRRLGQARILFAPYEVRILQRFRSTAAGVTISTPTTTTLRGIRTLLPVRVLRTNSAHQVSGLICASRRSHVGMDSMG